MFGDTFKVSDFSTSFSLRAYPDANDNTIYVSTLTAVKTLPELYVEA